MARSSERSQPPALPVNGPTCGHKTDRRHPGRASSASLPSCAIVYLPMAGAPDRRESDHTPGRMRSQENTPTASTPCVCEHFKAMSFQATGSCFLHSQVPASGSVKSGGLGDGPKSGPPLPARRDSQHESTTAKLRLTVPHQCHDIFTHTDTVTPHVGWTFFADALPAVGELMTIFCAGGLPIVEHLW